MASSQIYTKGKFKLLPQSKEAIKFLEEFAKIFPIYPTSNEFKNATAFSQNERSYSDALSKFWSFHSSRKYTITPESPQPRSRAVDFDVTIFDGIRIMTIEAKVFPIPSGKDRSPWEYVYGQGGGIQRYRDEQHGFDYDGQSLFLDIAMIGYVLSGSMAAWKTNVDDWIVSNWPSSEQLNEIITSPNFVRHISKHTRKSGSNLVLHHFWVKV